MEVGTIRVICKEMDDRSGAIETLQRLHSQATTEPQRRQIETDLRILRAGIANEQEAAYLLNLRLKDRRNTAVIHDLRIVLPDGDTAQIDHLLINRLNIFYILESKSFKHGVKINDNGEFLRWNDVQRRFEGMPSPLEQAERQATILRKLIKLLEMPEPEIKCYTLVSPGARIDRSKKFDTARVVKADQFVTTYFEGVDELNLVKAVFNLIRTDPVADVAQRIVGCHKPVIVNYQAKYGISDRAKAPSVSAPENSDSLPACRHCSKSGLSIEYGKFGYYFKCRSCDGNTPIKLACDKGHKERLRKDKTTFYRECAECGTSELYFSGASHGS